MKDHRQEQTNSICEKCDKKNQKDLPASDAASSEGMPCEQLYVRVSECMNQNGGQITSCRKEWDVFKKCHNDYK